MSNSIDEFTYQSALEHDNHKDYIASGVQYKFIPDENNGNYPQNQVIFDNQLGLERWAALRESFLTVPLKMVLTASGGVFVANENDFALSLKNGIQNLIHRINIEINTVAMNNPTPNANSEINFRLFQMSADDRRNYQDVINFAMDNGDSVRHYAASSAYGLGETNNVIKPTSFDPQTGYGNSTTLQNFGRLERMAVTSYNADRQTGVQYYIDQQTSLNGWSSGVVSSLTDTSTTTYYIYAVIPLTLIHPIFSALPALVRGMRLRLTLDLNTGSWFNVPITGGNFIKSGYTSYSPNGTMPIMISPIGGGLYQNAATSVKGSIDIGNDIKNCRMYTKLVKLCPDAEKALVEDAVKEVNYLDYINFQQNGIVAGNPVNTQVTGGISRIRSFLMIPQLSSTSNYLGVSPLNSPFSTAPVTTANAPISNFQLVIGDDNVFENGFNYGFEHFLEEIRPTLSVNGGATTGCSSGSLSKSMWEHGSYRYYYVDLTRHESVAKDDASKKVQLIFNNLSKMTIDYTIIISYMRRIYLNVSNGQLVNAPN